MSTSPRVAFNNRILSPLAKLVKDGAERRGVPVRDELERALRVAYLEKTPAPAAPPASNLLATSAVAGQRVQIVLDGSGALATGVVVAAIPLGTSQPAAGPSREQRTSCFEPDSQENWAQ
jgi:hypothetical protein